MSDVSPSSGGASPGRCSPGLGGRRRVPAKLPQLTGIVLAGGRSRRMGRDKARLPFPLRSAQPGQVLGGSVRGAEHIEGLAPPVGSGRSARVAGGELECGDRSMTLLGFVTSRLAEVAGHVIVVSKEDNVAAESGVQVVLDPLPERAAMVGILGGLAASPTDWNVVVACDMPFVSVSLIAALFHAVQPPSRHSRNTGLSEVDRLVAVPSTVDRLVAVPSTVDRLVAVPSTERGPEPLHGIWHRSVADLLEDRLRRGCLGLMSLLEEINALVLDPRESLRWDPSGRFARNVNTPDEYREALEAAAVRPTFVAPQTQVS